MKKASLVDNLNSKTPESVPTTKIDHFGATHHRKNHTWLPELFELLYFIDWSSPVSKAERLDFFEQQKEKTH